MKHILFNILIAALVLIATLVVIGAATALSPARADTRVPEYVTTALLIADWGTTLSGLERDDVYETNRLLGGKDATRGSVNRYFIIKSALHLFWNYSKHPFFRQSKNVWNVSVIAVTAPAVKGNLSLGLEVNFK